MAGGVAPLQKKHTPTTLESPTTTIFTGKWKLLLICLSFGEWSDAAGASGASTFHVSVQRDQRVRKEEEGTLSPMGLF